MSKSHIITDADSIKTFVTAGKAVITLKNQLTGGRFTYRITKNPKPNGVSHFVKLLTGSDNDTSYSYLGCIFQDGNYSHGSKSPIGPDSKGAKGWDFFWAALNAGTLPPALQVWHEGKCGRCGKTLTVPESVESGFGPECVKLVGC